MRERARDTLASGHSATVHGIHKNILGPTTWIPNVHQFSGYDFNNNANEYNYN